MGRAACEVRPGQGGVPPPGPESALARALRHEKQPPARRHRAGRAAAHRFQMFQAGVTVVQQYSWQIVCIYASFLAVRGAREGGAPRLRLTLILGS